MASSYNGWIASRDPQAINVNTRWEPIRGHRFPGGIKGGDVETLFTYLVRQLDARVEPIEEYPPGDEWGYSYRANVNNPMSLSCHASGTAIDYNATQHPNRVDFTWTRDQVREIHRILDECSGVIRWLEGFDEMHFEVRGTPLQVRAAVRNLPKPTPPTPPKPPAHLYTPGDLDMTVLRRGQDNTKHVILLVTDKASRIGVRGFFSEDGGFSSDTETTLDRSAWKGVVDDWLVANEALTKV